MLLCLRAVRPRARPTLIVTVLTAVLLAVGMVDLRPAEAATTTLVSSRHYVAQTDPVVLSGRAAGSVGLYRSLDGGSYARIGTVSGSFRVTVRPVAGRFNRYRAGNSLAVNVHSTACTPLWSTGSVNTWFNEASAESYIGTNIARVICTAGFNSTVNVAAMIFSGGSPSAYKVIAALQTVAVYRGVRVHVVVDSGQYYAGGGSSWSLTHLRSALSFATFTACSNSCGLGAAGQMHSKFVTVSASTFGGSMVVETTLNFTPQQFDRQNGSAIYFYNRTALYNALVVEFRRYELRAPATVATESRGWLPAGDGVAVAFDPSTYGADPIGRELETLSCQPGDYIEMINANVTRGKLVRALNRFAAQGCLVRVITEQVYRSPDATFPQARFMTTHDKFVLVRGHTASGALVREVMTGSEDFRPSSMTSAEEQLVRVRDATTVDNFVRWFAKEWGLAS